MNKILGIHHITAIAGNARHNYNFYTKLIGLRLVKKTVNFDDPHTYHLYFGNETGTPGTILSFFPWEEIQKGITGTGMATDIGYSVPLGSLAFWKNRFETNNIRITSEGKRFGEEYITFQDPDGLQVTLIASADNREPWATDEIPKSVATRGFHSATLTLKSKDATEKVLTEILRYEPRDHDGNKFRYVTNAIPHGSIIDIIQAPDEDRAINAGGTIHHIAFRVKDERTQMEYREKLLKHGFDVTPKIDRNYFFSIYFREPGGVLFEIATDNPGFDVDEPVNELGQNLKLPRQYESHRTEIEKILPALS